MQARDEGTEGKMADEVKWEKDKRRINNFIEIFVDIYGLYLMNHISSTLFSSGSGSLSFDAQNVLDVTIKKLILMFFYVIR